MNLEALNTMPDDELRIKAAELTGRWFTCSVEDGVPSGLAYLLPAEKDEGYQELPDYPNDIAAAWTLVEINQDWRWSVYELDSAGDTAQRAITLAFILAMDPS